MNNLDLLREWPQWKNVGAETILSSPAFAKVVGFQGKRHILTSLEALEEDTIDLAVSFENEECILSLADSEAFPELHLVWKRRRELPQALLLALIENDCGEFLQFIENQAKRQLAIVGLLDDKSNRKPQHSFRLGTFRFALNLPVCLTVEWGKLENIDTAHPLVRAMTRPAVAEYACYTLSDQDIDGLVVGDCLLMPENVQESARWNCADDADNRLYVRGTESIQISFGEFSDGALPEIPVANNVLVYRKNQVIAEGHVDCVGEGKCFKLTHLR